jgi:hypothetical protein
MGKSLMKKTSRKQRERELDNEPFATPFEARAIDEIERLRTALSVVNYRLAKANEEIDRLKRK